MSQYTIGDSNNNCHITTNSHNTTTNNVWNNCTVADDLSPLLTWLSPLDPGLRHSDIQERRVNDVGEWLMGTEEFRRWSGLSGEGEGNEAVLFCYGNPGVGKTFISSLVVDWLSDRTKGRNTAVVCFYFDFAARNEQTAISMLGSLLKQVISGMERLPGDISHALQEQRKAVRGRKPQLGDIVKMLQLITSSQPTFMVIDALDECTTVQRFRLFDSLKEIVGNSPDARIFVTGRPHICAEIERSLAGRVICVSVGPTRDDIVRFLRVRLSEDEIPDAMDESLEADILEKIPRSIPEMFLLVSLNIEAILQEATTYRRREKLSKMTPGLGLGDAYDVTIERIKAQGGDKSRLGIGALMWISHAVRPFTADQLCHALAIELGSTDFNSGNIPSMTTLLSCCQGLITVDKWASNVRLIHFTLKEYLSAHPDIFTRPHSAMAEACLTYLNSQQVKALPVDAPKEYADFNPFLEYCSLYWGVHAKQDLSNCARLLAVQLLQQYNGHVSTFFLVRHIRSLDLPMWSVSYRLSGVHCASFFGIVEMVAALIEIQGYGTNKGWYLGDSPLALAALNGHEEVVKMLVGWEGVDPDQPNDHGQTPLSYAAGYGQEGVVEILLRQAEVNPDRDDNLGRTPLSYAVGRGHEGVVMMLLRRAGVSPDMTDDRGRTPLSHAAEHGQEMMVKILLGLENVDADKPDNQGRTPLSHAAFGGHEGVVKMLLGREEVDPDKQDNSGSTPLSWAAWVWSRINPSEKVLKLLLGREEVNPDKADYRGQTPLSNATRARNWGMVEILLAREEVDPDKQDNDGRTPLSYAVECGSSALVEGGVLKLLLGREEVNPDKPDNDGRTPLSHAAENGNEDGVKILLGREEVNFDQADNNGRTPLSHAAGAGREEVVEILLRREEVDPDKQDNNGRSPLSHAAQSQWVSVKRVGVVKLLLGREEVNPDKPDNRGRTPLSYASRGKHSEDKEEYMRVIKMLLERGDVIPDQPDNDGRTPLSYAAEHGFEGAVGILLGREEVSPNKQDNLGRTPLMLASSGAHEEVVTLLRSREAVAPLAKCESIRKRSRLSTDSHSHGKNARPKID